MIGGSGVEPDDDDQTQCQQRRRNPFFARRPSDPAHFRCDPGEKCLGLRRSRSPAAGCRSGRRRAASRWASPSRLARPIDRWLHRCFQLKKDWQGGQDSNLQQLVLETRTLPIELPPSAPGTRSATALRRSRRTRKFRRPDSFSLLRRLVARRLGAVVTYFVSRWERWQRQKRQYLLSSSRSVVFCLFFWVL